jgi:SAM-dependent methyltransferase
MHSEITQWLDYVKNTIGDAYPHLFSKCSVLDVGSLDVCGTARPYWSGCAYTGLDIAPGPGVDVVSVCHEWNPPGGPYETVVSCDALEHDMHWRKTLPAMVRLLKPGGLLVFTCASTGRLKHGTVDSIPSSSPLTVARGGEWGSYYQNLAESDIRSVLDIERTFWMWEFSTRYGSMGLDLRMWGLKNFS